MCRSAAVVAIPRVLAQIGVGQVIPIAEPRRGPRAARIPPPRLRRQPIDTVGRNAPRDPVPLRELAAVVRGVEPSYHFHRTIHVTLEMTWIAAHHRQIFSLGHLIFPHPKPPADRHRSQWIILA